MGQMHDNKHSQQTGFLGAAVSTFPCEISTLLSQQYVTTQACLPYLRIGNISTLQVLKKKNNVARHLLRKNRGNEAVCRRFYLQTVLTRLLARDHVTPAREEHKGDVSPKPRRRDGCVQKTPSYWTPLRTTTMHCRQANHRDRR